MNNKAITIIVVILLLVAGMMIFTKSNNKTMQEATSTKSSVKPTATTKTYTLAEVSEHASETDCWMSIEKKVYNVTEFVSKHPGGKAILNGCGKDATKLFNERPTNNKGPHPAAAQQGLKKLYIGELK